jgi:hypothetical protein
LRRTLGPTCAAQRIIHALLGRGQAAARDQRRSCDRTQQALSHLDHSFITANCGETRPLKDGSRLFESKIDWLKYEYGEARPLLTVPEQARSAKLIWFEHLDQNKLRAAWAIPKASGICHFAPPKPFADSMP